MGWSTCWTTLVAVEPPLNPVKETTLRLCSPPYALFASNDTPSAGTETPQPSHWQPASAAVYRPEASRRPTWFQGLGFGFSKPVGVKGTLRSAARFTVWCHGGSWIHRVCVCNECAMSSCLASQMRCYDWSMKVIRSSLPPNITLPLPMMTWARASCWIAREKIIEATNNGFATELRLEVGRFMMRRSIAWFSPSSMGNVGRIEWWWHSDWVSLWSDWKQFVFKNEYRVGHREAFIAEDFLIVPRLIVPSLWRPTITWHTICSPTSCSIGFENHLYGILNNNNTFSFPNH